MPKETKVQRGEPMNASLFNRILGSITSRIVSGKGIIVTRVGQNVVISATAQPSARTGGGNGNARIFFGTTLGTLELNGATLADGDFAMTTGTNKRGYMRAGSAWVSITHLEA